MHHFLSNIRRYLLVALAWLWFLLRFPRRHPKSSPKRILVIPQLTRVGDIICATPVLRALKEHFPDRCVAVVVGPKAAGILKNNPHIDELVVFEFDEYEHFFGVFRFFKRVRALRCDVALNLAGSVFGTLISVFADVPVRIKIVRQPRPPAEFFTDWLNTHRVKYEPGVFLPELYLRTLLPIGIRATEVRKEVFVAPDADEKIARFFASRNIPVNAFLIGMSFFAGNPIKEWPPERFVALAERLMKEYQASVVFIGTPAEKKRLEWLGISLPHGAVDAYDFSLEELPSLMRRFSLFIAADTGPIHIADALGIPLIDIIGPVDPSEQAPRGRQCIVLTPPATIEPSIFAFREAGDPALSRQAAQAITVEEVAEAVARLLKQNS